MMQKRTSPQRTATTVVEMAFVSMTCIFLMFAIFEYGRYMFVRQVMENAAQTGARLAVITPTSYLSDATANANVGAAVTTAMANIPVQPTWTWTAYQANTGGANIGDWTATQFGNNLMVQIDADLPVLFPGFKFLQGNTSNTVHITTYCMMRSEAN